MSLVPRGRLSGAIETAALKGVAFVIAPAGFGKSEAIRDAFSDIGIFVALESTAPTFDEVAMAIVGAARRNALGALVAHLKRPANGREALPDAETVSWIAARLRDVDVPIVLDDFHRIDGDERARNLVSQLIELTAPRLRWVIASRETPRLPVGTWLARGLTSVPLMAADLAFRIDEAAALAERLGATIGADELQAIVAESEGWAFVLRIALAEWERTRAALPLRIRTRAVLYDFLDQQIWARLNAGERRVLTGLAVCGEATTGLLGQAGLPGVGGVLAALEDRVPLVERRETGEYRLHELFRDFILERHLDARSRRDLVLTFIVTHRQMGLGARALELAIGTGDWTIVDEILAEEGFALLERGDRTLIGRALAALPASYHESPNFLTLRGLIFALDGKTGPAETDLRAAIARPGLGARLRAQSIIRLAQILVNHGESTAALALLEDREQYTVAEQLEMSSFVAMAHAALGDTRTARTDIEATQALMATSPGELQARVLTRLAASCCHISDWTAAERLARSAVDLAEGLGLDGVAARAYSALLSATETLYPDTSMAAQYVQAYVNSAKLSGERDLHAAALVAQVCVAAERGDDATFDTAYRELRTLRYTADPWRDVAVRFARVVHDVGLRRFTDARLVLSAIDRRTISHAGGAFVDSVLALVHIMLDQREQAYPILDRTALAISEQDYYSRRQLVLAAAYRTLGLWLVQRGREARRLLSIDYRFLPEQDQMLMRVIQSICTTPIELMTRTKLENFTAPLIGAEMNGHARFLTVLCQPAIVQSPLSHSELEVLRQLRAGLTPAEIGARLGRSPKTIQNHIYAACQKVNCSRRRDAVRYAVEQGWLE